MSAIKGDFIGFTFGGIHSSELGINRVSNGSRYTETLLPEFSNKTMNVPGANRVDYLGMEYTQKSFPLDIAFDSVTEEQLREMRRLFSTDKPLPLVFDESPYKTYYAKAGGNPSFTYVCFDEKSEKKNVITFNSKEKQSNYIFSSNYTFEMKEQIYYEIEINHDGVSRTFTKRASSHSRIDFSESKLSLYYLSWKYEKDKYPEEEGTVYFIRISQNNENNIEVKLTKKTPSATSEEAMPVNEINIKIFIYTPQRVYKGEGKIDLVSFYPYAFCELEENLIEITRKNHQQIIIPGLTLESLNESFWGRRGSNIFGPITRPTLLQDGKIQYTIISNLEILIYDPISGEFNWTSKEGHNGTGYDNGLQLLFYVFKNANVSEWRLESGFNRFLLYPKEMFVVSNPGDFDTPFQVYGVPTEGEGHLQLGDKTLRWKGIVLKGNDRKIRINTANQLIEGLDENEKITGNIYNEYITEGNWFNIPVNYGTMVSSQLYMYKSGFVNTATEKPRLEYKILYI